MFRPQRGSVRTWSLLLVLSGSSGPLAYGFANLLLPNQARIEQPVLTMLQYHPSGGATLELSQDRPQEGAFCLHIKPPAGLPQGPEYGVATSTASTRERVYWYEKATWGEETPPWPVGPYTLSAQVRGGREITVTITTDTGERVTRKFAANEVLWQRIAVTLPLAKFCNDFTFSFAVTGSRGDRTGFYLDRVQFEKGGQATPFDARALPTGRPPITSPGFLWRTGERIVCLGDSITDWAPGYVPVLRDRVRQKYPERPLTIIRSGCGGNTFGALLARTTVDVVVREPDWVLVNGGLNDVGHKVPLDQSRSDLEALVKLLLDATTAQVVLVEASPFQGRPDLAPGITALNQMVNEVARANHLLVVPLEQVISQAKAAGKNLYFSDPHFNAEGFTLMADTILKALHY